MARLRQPFGPNLQKVLERAPVAFARELFEKLKRGDGPMVNFLDLDPEVDRAGFTAFLAALDKDILGELDDVSRQVVDLSEGKGSSSLNTVVDRKMYNTEILEYEAQPDELCRSIWIFTRFPAVFMDARSFHSARRHRDHGKLYSAFEVANDLPAVPKAEDIDLEELSSKISDSLDIPAKTTASAIDLPATDSHPPSIMVAVRHGGPLSSIQDHRENGLRETLYVRSANEAILIYTPAERKLEVCASGYVVQEKTSNCFAQCVLGQDLANTPLTKRNFNLERFRSSLHLPVPEFGDVEITFAKVTELETRLGNWKRRLLIQVTPEDDIEYFVNRFMDTVRTAAERFGYSRVALVAGYTDRETGEKGTLKLWVSAGNKSNAPNASDPKLRDLGLRLLEFWGVLERQRFLDEIERARHFEGLLFLYDFPDDEISGADLFAARLDVTRLVSAMILEKKGRQDIILIEDDGDITEADVGTGRTPETVAVSGAFGDDLGTQPTGDFTIYRINRRFLSDIVLEALRRELAASRGTTETDHIAAFGDVEIRGKKLPVYLVRAIHGLKKPAELDLEFRRRHTAGPGLILSTGETHFRYLGSNVVVPLRNVIRFEDDNIIIDLEALEQIHLSGQAAILAGDAPQIIRHAANHATLHLPGRPPLNLFHEMQTLLFRRLVDAAISGQRDVQTSQLMKGMGSKSPQQLFSKPVWSVVRDSYLTQAHPKTWRLGPSESVVI